jgi:hypothetical protein
MKTSKDMKSSPKKLEIKNRATMNVASMSGCGKSTDNQCGMSAKLG